MIEERCDRTPRCARIQGHAGCCTARPAPVTHGWDRNREETTRRHIDAAVTLLALDFDTPWWADLLDEEAS